MSEKLGHVRVGALRQFIKKNNNFFKQRKIMTLRKQEAIDVINQGLAAAPEAVSKEWNRLKTMKGEEVDKTGPSKASPVPVKKTRKKAKPEEAMPPKKLVQLEKQFKTKPVSEGVPQRRAKTPTRKRVGRSNYG